ncbi:MAG: leucine--tRNA ligase [Elusimicrobia bacterium]|nr:leucine--tRNA ligase [Elusimicrobiota bacterium]
MSRYEPRSIEPKWQRRWEEAKIFRSQDKGSGPKYYILDMFPYPSAAGLHVGHPEGYTATDIIARMKRMQGMSVLHPMGWDAFGLPTENYAIATGIHPAKVTQDCVTNFRRQIKSLGFSYDWDREINTTDPEYYRWTQWIFLQLFKKGLAYEAVVPINFCPSCKTGLANEEVHQGGCERCGTAAIKKDMRQWMLKITAYADRLLEDLEGLDWPASTLLMQKNWIGLSDGAQVDFEVAEPAQSKGKTIAIFTTRPDTLFGATYMVLAPEHPLVNNLTTAQQRSQVEQYCQAASAKTEIERTDEGRAKTGVFTGGYALNPVNGEKIPIWVADYVLYHYGTGAIMSVPAHDQRDFEFAKAYNLPMRQVVWPTSDKYFAVDRAYEDDGFAHNSGEFNGLPTAEFKVKITAWLKDRKLGFARRTYKLRDWVFSRQRYWGEPIPIVHCKGRCAKAVPVAEKDLPVTLPDVARYEPAGTGESPLAGLRDWVNTKCPDCGGPAERETNTMPQWAGSCWYYLRFIDPKNDQAAWDKALEKRWMAVDLYVGGSEHAVLHLLYSRFWHKVLYDSGLVSTKEPFIKLRHQGMILSYSFQDQRGAYHGYDELDASAENPRLKATGEVLSKRIEKMSKSKKNVVNPDEIIRDWGADTMRLYEMFMGEFELSKPWDMTQIEGVHRFLQRVWRLVAEKSGAKASGSDDCARLRHKTIKLVTERIESFKFNTAITALMEYVNALIAQGAGREDLETLLKLVSPFAPHLAEECWELLGNKPFVSSALWPSYDENLAQDEKVAMPVQINGKVRETLELGRGAISQQELVRLAKENPRVSKHLENAKILKVIYVPGRILNFVIQKESTDGQNN